MASPALRAHLIPSRIKIPNRTQICPSCSHHILRNIVRAALCTSSAQTSSPRPQATPRSWRKPAAIPRQTQRSGSRYVRKSVPRPSGTLQMRKAQSSEQAKQLEEQKKLGEHLDHVGILPDTLIMPENLMRWFDRALLWQWAKVRFVEQFSYFNAWRTYRKAKELDRIKKGDLAQVAQELHEEMSVAYAQGQIEDLHPILCQGIFKTLGRKILLRSKEQGMRWSVVERQGKPTIVSYKVALLPTPPGEEKDVTEPGIIQAVVKLKLKQRLETFFKDSKMSKSAASAKSTVVEKTTTEYVVVQKPISLGKESDWKIFGTTEPMSTLDQWQKDNYAKKERMQVAQAQLERMKTSMGR